MLISCITGIVRFGNLCHERVVAEMFFRGREMKYLQLTLIPLSPEDLGKTLVHCNNQLSFTQDYRIFGQLIDFDKGDLPTIKARPIPPQMLLENCKNAPGKRTREDGNGAELTFVRAKQLKDELEIPRGTSPGNVAVMKFIDRLPDDTPIILFWW